MVIPYRSQKPPIYLMPDEEIRNIRAWRGKVRDLRMFRAKNRCEICGQKHSEKYAENEIRGHHIVRPSEYKGKDPECDNNIIICCHDCYKRYVLCSYPVPMPSPSPAIICLAYYQEPLGKWGRIKKWVGRLVK